MNLKPINQPLLIPFIEKIKKSKTKQMCWVSFKIIHHRLKQIQSFHNSEKIFFLLEFIFVHVYVTSKFARMCGQFC